MASCELVNSSSLQTQVTGNVPTFAIDKCDGVQVGPCCICSIVRLFHYQSRCLEYLMKLPFYHSDRCTLTLIIILESWWCGCQHGALENTSCLWWLCWCTSIRTQGLHSLCWSQLACTGMVVAGCQALQSSMPGVVYLSMRNCLRTQHAQRFAALAQPALSVTIFWCQHIRLGWQIFLSESSVGVEILTAKSSEVNVSLLQADGEEPTEHALPEQFVSRFVNGRFITEPVSHSGG